MMRFKLQNLWEKWKGSQRHMKRLWAGRRNGGVWFGSRFGETVGLANQEGDRLKSGRW